MEVCFLMLRNPFWGFVTIVTLRQYLVNRFLRLIALKFQRIYREELQFTLETDRLIYFSG